MTTTTKDMIEQFNNMDKLPMFEIEHNGEYYTYNIEATEKGLEAEGCTIEWDDIFSLDEHLQELYELCLKDAVSQDTRDEITESDLTKKYEESINAHGDVEIGYITFSPADILRELDQTAYRCGLNDFYDSIRDQYYCGEME